MTDWREALWSIWTYAFSTPERATATFTAVLAISTICLWWSTRKLWRVTRVAAEHIPHVERAYVSGGAVGVSNLPRHFLVTINNYGKTPAFIGTVSATICLEKDLPSVPVYERGWFGSHVLKPDTPAYNSGVTRLWDGTGGSVIYGRIWYRDIFKRYHSAGFILRILGPLQTVAVENQDIYWEDRDEPDLGPAAR
jgi:hypothetical protein